MTRNDWQRMPIWLMTLGGIACLVTGFMSWRFWHFNTAGTLGSGFIERAFTERRQTRGGPRTDYYADVRYRPRGGELRLVKRVETDSPDFRQGFNYDILYFPERPDDIVFKARVEKQFPYFVVAAIMSLTAFVMGVIWWLGVRPQRVDTTWDKPPTPIEGRPEFWEPPSR